MILGDSAEYEFLTEAVEMSKDVEGVLCEVGLRLGMGTKTIIDAAMPGRTVISIDPFGNIPYTGREHVGDVRLDYTNDMYKQVLADMSAYVLDKPIEWILFKMTDEQFFDKFSGGIPLYDTEAYWCNKYAMVHLDGPHTVDALCREGLFFSVRMDKGATLAVDDVTIDFVDISPVNSYYKTIGLELVKEGLKKNIYVKH